MSVYLPSKDDILTMCGQIAPLEQEQIDACYEALRALSADIPEVKSLENLPDAIHSIRTLTDKMLEATEPFDVSSDVSSLGNYAFKNTLIRSADFPNLKTMDGTETFYGCYRLESVNMPSLTSITGTGYRAFGVSDSSTGNPYRNQFLLKELSFPTLKSCTSQQAVCQINSLTSVSCPELTASGTRFVENCAGVTEIYMPMLKTWIQGVTGYPNRLVKLTIGPATSTATIVYGSATSSLREIHIELPGATVLARTNYFTNIPTTGNCVFYCTDGTVEYVEGAWTFIPAES